MSMSEKLTLSGNVAFVGISVVFLILLSLILVVSVFGLFSKTNTKKNKKNPANPILDEDYGSGNDSEDSDTTVLESASSDLLSSADENDETIIAAIMAAISVVMGSVAGFKIKSIRRSGRNTPSWNRAGRDEYHTTRL